jgi:hypothetical protein
MRTILSMITSLVLAAGLCLGLSAAGVIDFNGQRAVKMLKTLKEKGASLEDQGAVDPSGLIEKTKEVLRQQISQKPEKLEPSQEEVPAVPAAAKHEPERRNEEAIYSEALSFLKRQTDKGPGDIEAQFERHLREDLGLDKREAGRWARMSFWKGFVTLQHPWAQGDKAGMAAAFEKEKMLKQAGFAAKGLTLLETEVDEAEAQLKVISGAGGEEAQMGGQS